MHAYVHSTQLMSCVQIWRAINVSHSSAKQFLCHLVSLFSCYMKYWGMKLQENQMIWHFTETKANEIGEINSTGGIYINK
jgi:hypothetical protein